MAEAPIEIIVNSALSATKLRSVLENAPLNMSVVSITQDTVVARRGSKFKYRMLGAYFAAGRDSFPARITVGPVDGEPGKRRVEVYPDTGFYIFTMPIQNRVVTDLAQSVASAVAAAS